MEWIWRKRKFLCDKKAAGKSDARRRQDQLFCETKREVDNKKVTNTWRVIEERRNEKKAKHTRLSEGFLNE
jgi:hypothetical protein